MTSTRVVSASTVISAPAAVVFDLLANPSRHVVIDGSGTAAVRNVVRGPDRLFLGANFAMSMRLVVPYVMVNRVVEFEEGRLIAWTHVSRAVWRYELEPIDATTTRVTESFDIRRSWLAGVYERMSVLASNQRGIERSLALLKDVTEHEHLRSS